LDWTIANNLASRRGLFDVVEQGASLPVGGGPNNRDPPGRRRGGGGRLVSDEEDGARSPNLLLVNIIETYLLPTAYGGAGGGGGGEDAFAHGNNGDNNISASNHHHLGGTTLARATKHHAVNSSYVRAVADASRAMNKMRRLQQQQEHPNNNHRLRPDSLSVKAELNVWAKRATILAGGKTWRSGGSGHGLARGAPRRGDDRDDDDPREMLRMMELEDAVGKDGGMVYDDDAYTYRGCLGRMECILAEAEERYVSSGRDVRIRPSCDWYNHVLGAWTRSDDAGEALERSRRMLGGMEAYQDNDDDDDDAAAAAGIRHNNDDIRRCFASPDTVTYNTVLFSLTRDTAKRSGAREAEELLRRLDDRYRRTGDADMRPDEVTYGTVLHALARAGMAREAERILDSLEGGNSSNSNDDTNGENGENGIVPSLTIYNTVLNAWANSPNRRDAPRRAESLLERMRALSSTGRNPYADPDSISVSTVISCHARSKTRAGAERGERMLDEAIAMYNNGDARVKPDVIMYNCAISGWTGISGVESEQHNGGGPSGNNSNNNGGSIDDTIPAERAEMLLRRMTRDSHRRYDDRGARTAASTFAFNIVLDGWAKSGRAGAADRALRLMEEMPDHGAVPDEVSYNSVLHAMTKESDPKWVARAERLFQEMKDKKVPVDEITYHVLMNIYSKSGDDRDGGSKVEELLRGMHGERMSPSDISYNICIDAYARRGNHEKASGLLEEMIELSNNGRAECRPTIHSFASVVNALAKSGDVDAVSHAKEVVRKVEEDLHYVAPNSILYNSLIDCIVKSGQREGANDAASQAEEVLRTMEVMHRSGNSNVRPNAYGYSMVLTCCARSKEPGAAERAERILVNMERLHAEGLSDVVANSRCYSAAITAWARSGSLDAVDRAIALVDRMERNGRDGASSPHGKPNAHCYNACIHAIAKSREAGKARRCREVLERMVAARDDGFHEAAPSLITYSTIINACAYTNGNEDEKKEAFDLARTCFQTLLESADMDPCDSSFANFFLVISKHLKHGAVRDQFAEAIFLEGCKRGKMGKLVLSGFRKASPSVANRILSEYRVYPREWTNKMRSRSY